MRSPFCLLVREQTGAYRHAPFDEMLQAAQQRLVPLRNWWIAELGSAFLLGHVGLVEAAIEGHASYLDNWLHVLKRDRTTICTAARHAGAAYELNLTNEAL